MPPPTIESVVRTKGAEATRAYSAPARLGNQTAVTCRHRWVIDTKAVASRYPAKCRRCGAKRTFPTEPKLEHGRGNWGRRPVE